MPVIFKGIRKTAAVFTILGAAALLPVDSFAREADAGTLQALTAKWTELKKAFETEKLTWEEEKAFLQRELELLRKEKSELEKEITEAERSENQFLKERAGLLKEQEDFNRKLAALEPSISRAEAWLKGWREKIPGSLAENYKKLFNELKFAPEGSVSRHLQAIFALYSEFENLQSEFHTTREFLAPADRPEQEYEVLYQGLTRAFAVSVDGKRAAIGMPAEREWVWKAADKYAGEFRKALDFHNKEKVAEFVALPLQIDSGASHEN